MVPFAEAYMLTSSGRWKESTGVRRNSKAPILYLRRTPVSRSSSTSSLAKRTLRDPHPMGPPVDQVPRAGLGTSLFPRQGEVVLPSSPLLV